MQEALEVFLISMISSCVSITLFMIIMWKIMGWIADIDMKENKNFNY